jgi:hypothetical protein
MKNGKEQGKIIFKKDMLKEKRGSKVFAYLLANRLGRRNTLKVLPALDEVIMVR